MTNSQFSNVIEDIRSDSLSVLLQRNGNYAKGSDDALHNFKVGADIDGSTPAQAAWGYMTKHMVALRDKIKRNDFADLDDLLEKCTDIINYTAIIFAIGCEENEKYNRTHGTCAAEQAPLFSVPPRFFEEDNE
jgi:hypothetical protein